MQNVTFHISVIKFLTIIVLFDRLNDDFIVLIIHIRLNKFFNFEIDYNQFNNEKNNVFVIEIDAIH